MEASLLRTESLQGLLLCSTRLKAIIYRNFGKEEDGDAIMAGKARAFLIGIIGCGIVCFYATCLLRAS